MQESKTLTVDQEIKNMEAEPLNEMEMKLIKWSLSLGVVLLVAFYLLAQVLS